jgi:lipid A oxidase
MAPNRPAASIFSLLIFLSITTFATLGFTAVAHAEFVLSAYGGAIDTMDADVKLSRPGGTDLTFSDVSWNDKSFEGPMYYGLRLNYWFSDDSNWGVGIDFTHAKMYARLNDTVTVSGTRAGANVSGSEPLNNTFEELSFSHGYNLLIFNGTYRWFPKGSRDNTFLGRLQPYAGLGLGVAVPHVEVDLNGSKTEEYQYAGPAFQGLAGINFDVYKNFSVFLEYKLTYSDMNADLTDGGSIEVKPWSNHIVFGLSYSFR